MAATLRPETMYGQTNAWVLPEGKYGAFRGLNGEIYVLTERSARNLSYQVCVGVCGGGEWGERPLPPLYLPHLTERSARDLSYQVCVLWGVIGGTPSVLPRLTEQPVIPGIWKAASFLPMSLHSSSPIPSSLPPLQENTPIRGQPECLMELTGQDLIGVPVRSPNATHDRVYVLPLLTILTNKGTGVVTSVPSDSPDDYMALQVRG